MFVLCLRLGSHLFVIPEIGLYHMFGPQLFGELRLSDSSLL
jgi:hypothetical protein